MAIALYRQDTVLTAWEVSCNAAQKRCPEAAEILNIFMLTRNFLNPYLNTAHNHLPISLIYAHSIPNIEPYSSVGHSLLD